MILLLVMFWGEKIEYMRDALFTYYMFMLSSFSLKISTFPPDTFRLLRGADFLWRFEGDWSSKERAIVRAVMRHYEYKHGEDRGWTTWLLVCYKHQNCKDFHAVYGTKVSLYGDSVEQLVQKIRYYYETGNPALGQGF